MVLRNALHTFRRELCVRQAQFPQAVVFTYAGSKMDLNRQTQGDAVQI